MFREMRRMKQALTPEEIEEVLTKETRGVLSMYGTDGYPYGIPMNHYYDAESRSLYFHGSGIGHKAEAIRKDSKVSYCVFGQEFCKEGDWARYVKSVVVFGSVELIEESEEIAKWSRRLCSKFPCPSDYAEEELRTNGNRVRFFAIRIEHATGKLVHEA